MPQPFFLYYFLGKFDLRSKQPFYKFGVTILLKFETPESSCCQIVSPETEANLGEAGLVSWHKHWGVGEITLNNPPSPCHC